MVIQQYGDNRACILQLFTGSGANITSTFKTKHTDFKKAEHHNPRETPFNLCGKHVQFKAMSGVTWASVQEI